MEHRSRFSETFSRVSYVYGPTLGLAYFAGIGAIVEFACGYSLGGDIGLIGQIAGSLMAVVSLCIVWHVIRDDRAMEARINA